MLENPTFEQQDWDFIWSLRIATMKDVIAGSYGWDEETQRTISLYKRCGFEIYDQFSSDKIIMRWHKTQANTAVQPSN
jgi:hypothetical protein